MERVPWALRGVWPGCSEHSGGGRRPLGGAGCNRLRGLVVGKQAPEARTGGRNKWNPEAGETLHLGDPALPPACLMRTQLGRDRSERWAEGYPSGSFWAVHQAHLELWLPHPPWGVRSPRWACAPT